VNAYAGALQSIDRVAGRAFNLGGGPENAISLLQLVDEIGAVTGRKPDLSFEDWRPGDQRWYVSDAHQARTELNLPRPRGWREGVERLAQWLASERRIELRPELHVASAAE
jgi:CDP-paratose 2-epimerase